MTGSTTGELQQLVCVCMFACLCVRAHAHACVCVNVIAIQKQEFGTTMYHNCKNVCTLIIITKMLFQELSLITFTRGGSCIEFITSIIIAICTV